jgi:sulfatase maturation enzyme AslB (radical SAM superfamily)
MATISSTAQTKGAGSAVRGSPTGNDLLRIVRQPYLYCQLAKQYLHEGSVFGLIRSRLPFLLGATPTPRCLAIELTNACNIRCAYCPSQTTLRRPIGFMERSCFEKVMSQAAAALVQKVRIIGGGEPTLHPKFCEFLETAAGRVPILTVTTNGQRLLETSVAIVRCCNIVEVSVESDRPQEYERSRRGGSFAKLLEGLLHLRRCAQRSKPRRLIHIRLMVRPSSIERLEQTVRFWRQYGDTLSTQNLIDYPGNGQDLFPAPIDNRRCSSIFKGLGVLWNGDVPLCVGNEAQPAPLLGNVNTTPLLAIWQSELLRHYRYTHRRWHFDDMCQNCCQK